MEKARLFLKFLGTRHHKGLKLMNHLTTGGTAGSLISAYASFAAGPSSGA